MSLIKRLKDKYPEYDSKHEELIKKYTVQQGGKSGTALEAVTFDQGLYFHTEYEIYSYALVLGFKLNKRVAIPQGARKEKFMALKSWQHQEVVDYLILCLMASLQTDLIDIESEDVEIQVRDLKLALEEYANAGFHFLHECLKNNPDLIRYNDNMFLDILDEEIK